MVSATKISANNTYPIHIYQEVYQIIEKLHKTNGNYRYGKPPKLVIREKKTNGASYNFKTHTLYLDTTMYFLCKRFGIQSNDALAFIVGHELAHCYMEHYHFIEQNHYHWITCNETDKEKNADIYSLFNCYVAGYFSHNLLPELLIELYKDYNLPDDIPGYPSKQDRQKSTQEIIEIVDELVSIYESANYLSMIGQYDLAAASYEYILKYYQGREVYNNLAINQVLQAMNFTDQDYDLYLYPLEIDWNIRIRKPKKDKGSGELDTVDWQYKMQYLKMAQTNFETAISLDPSYHLTKINRFSVFVLMQQYEMALSYYERQISRLELSKKYQEQSRLVLANCYAQIDSKKETASQLFDQLQLSSNTPLIYAATYNQRVLEDDICGLPLKRSCPKPIEIPLCYEDICVHRFQSQQPKIELPYGYTMTIDKGRNSETYQFYKKNATLFSLQKISDLSDNSIFYFKEDEEYHTMLNGEGYLIHCPEDRLVFKCSSNNALSEWVRYY